MENSSNLSSRKEKDGWQTVKNPKKTKRQDQKTQKDVPGGKNQATRSSDGGPSVFSSLEDSAKERRSRIEASRLAAEASDVEDEYDADDDDEDVQAGSGKESGGEGKKPKEKKKKAKKVTVAEAAAAIDVQELNTFLSSVTESYASMPDVQLMRCADFFARAFSAVLPSQVNIAKLIRDSSLPRAAEVPLCDVPSPVIKATSEWLCERPLDQSTAFLLLLVRSAVEDETVQASRGGGGGGGGGGGRGTGTPAKAKVGMLVVLSILLRCRPEAMMTAADAIRTDPQCQGQDRLPILSWAYAQVAITDLPCALSLFLRNLLPLALPHGKSSSPLARDMALTFLETVVLGNLRKARSILISAAHRKGERLVPPLALSTFLRCAFPSAAAHTKASPRFASCYPTLKAVALAGASQSKATRAVAKQLLPLVFAAAGEQESQELQAEACQLFLWCLGEEPECFQLWERLHSSPPSSSPPATPATASSPDPLLCSAAILQFTVLHWSHFRNQLHPHAHLRACLGSLRNKHKKVLQDASSSSSSLLAAVRSADSSARRLQSLCSPLPGCAATVATLVAVAAMAYGFYRIGPTVNPWGWDGYILLSRTHRPY